jgi:hypothetical protein
MEEKKYKKTSFMEEKKLYNNVSPMLSKFHTTITFCLQK